MSFPAEEVEKLASSVFALERRAGDRVDVPIDFRSSSCCYELRTIPKLVYENTRKVSK